MGMSILNSLTESYILTIVAVMVFNIIFIFMFVHFHHTVSFKNARPYLPHSFHIPQTYHTVSQNFREGLTFLLLCINSEYSSPIKLLSKTKIFKRKHRYI